MKALCSLSAALILTIVLVSPVSAVADDFAVSNEDWNGLSKLVELTKDWGYKVNTNVTDTKKVVLVILAPDPEEGVDLSVFYQREGRILFADDFGNTSSMIAKLGIEIAGTKVTSRDGFLGNENMPVVSKFEPHEITREVSRVVTNHPSYISSYSGQPLAHFDDGRVFMVALEGSGKIVVLSDPSVFINQMLSTGDNYRLYRNILQFLTEGDRNYTVLFQDRAINYLKSFKPERSNIKTEQKEKTNIKTKIGEKSKAGESNLESNLGSKTSTVEGKTCENSKSRYFSVGTGKKTPYKGNVPGYNPPFDVVPVYNSSFDRDDKYGKVICYVYFNPYLGELVRISAMNAISQEYKAYLLPKTYRKLDVLGTVPVGYDTFVGEFKVSLKPGKFVRIPSVSPYAVIIQYETYPAGLNLEFYKDGADNYYVKGNYSGTVEIRVKMATNRSYFSEYIPKGLTLDDIPENMQIHVPQNVREKAEIVADRIGIKSEKRLDVIIYSLVKYFRSFQCGDIPETTVEPNDYLAIALYKNGACRHRALAFFITANAIGIPTRYVVSSCHAFVEVFVPKAGWLRFNLGGCGEVELVGAKGKKPYIPKGTGQTLVGAEGKGTGQTDETTSGISSVAEEVFDISPYLLLIISAVLLLNSRTPLSRIGRVFKSEKEPMSSFSRKVLQEIETGNYQSTAKIMAEEIYSSFLPDNFDDRRSNVIAKLVSRITKNVHHLQPESRAVAESLIKKYGLPRRETVKIVEKFEDIYFKNRHVSEKDVVDLYHKYRFLSELKEREKES